MSGRLFRIGSAILLARRMQEDCCAGKRLHVGGEGDEEGRRGLKMSVADFGVWLNFGGRGR